MYKIKFWENHRNYYININNLAFSFSPKTNTNWLDYKEKHSIMIDVMWDINNDCYHNVINKNVVTRFLLSHLK